MSIFNKLFRKHKPDPSDDTNLDVHIKFLNALRQPATALSVSKSPGTSRIGGLPNLPKDIEWPNWKEAPLAFLCQLDLSEIPVGLAEKLPKSGGLFFFYIQEQETWGFDPKDKGSWSVIYTKQSISTLPERLAPNGLVKEYTYKSKDITFKPIKTYPDWQDDRIDSLKLNDKQSDQYFELTSSVYEGEPAHQLFGFPSPVQGIEMDLECQLVTNGLYCGDSSGYSDPRRNELEPGKTDWKLLLQLDSDDDVEMMWGDCGMLYFWIKKQDLDASNFESSWMILQCS